MRKSMRKGFTLVELSIVLVIIGLLIGGVLVAQTMVGTSKVTAQVRQIGQFDALITNYKNRYNCLASDCLTSIVPIENGNYGGDNDNAIAIGTYWANYAWTFTGEIANFWHYLLPNEYNHLAAQPSYVSPDYGAAALTSGPYKNVPLSKFGKIGSFVIVAARVTPGTGVVIRPPENYYAIIEKSQMQLSNTYNGFGVTTSANSAVTPSEALALDKKIDDGAANNGNVLSSATTSGLGQATPPSACSSSASYTVTNSGYECTPIIRVGTVNGNLL